MLTIPDVYYSTHGDHLLCVKLEGEIVIQLTYEEALVFKERFEQAFKRQSSER
jgi:hypothetical protein|tara:strand:- start:485 stop:643 length:159 start_codon:yes stop_codon:yes gene_type:complete